MKRVCNCNGSEIKSIREHNIDLRDSFAVFRSGELYIIICRFRLILTQKFSAGSFPTP